MMTCAMTTPASRLWWRRFWPLYLLSMSGLWPLADQIRKQITRLELPAELAGNPEMLVTAGLVQTAALLLVASFIGAAWAHRLGLVSLLAQRQGIRKFRAELPLALAVGIMLGVAFVALDHWLFMPLSPGFAAATAQASGNPVQTLLLGLLYGGISEEIMMRWGLMTLICWIGVRLFGSGQGELPDWLAWAGILISAVAFALGHLPSAMQTGLLDSLSVVRILLLNTLAGTVFGWLYWRRSLESACVAHAMVHVCFHAFA